MDNYCYPLQRGIQGKIAINHYKQLSRAVIMIDFTQRMYTDS